MASSSVVKGKRPGQYILPQEGKVVELVEQAENEFYDTVQVTSLTADKVFKFFDVTQNKKDQHSSFTTPHKLIGIDEFTLQSIGIAPCQALGATVAAFADFLGLLWGMSLDFKINRRPIVKGPLTFFQPGVGATGSTVTTGGAAITNGVPSTAATRKLKVEQPIVGEVDVLEGSATSNDNSWLSGGSSIYTVTTAGNGVGLMFIGHGIEKNGLGK